MAESITDGLRVKAAHWSLAGDKQLLDVLQGLHQKIVLRCEETNRNLERMVTALDEASVRLQNTNNKFTALSNSQFVESRVYDDDAEGLTEPAYNKEQPSEDIKEHSELDNIKRSLQVLEDMHETVTILCESDSDSGTDGDDDIARVVLKPKDLYSGRPLPHVIGSQAWRTKWHAGLVVEDSDSDSASSKREHNDEQYSDSEPAGSASPSYTTRKQHTPSISSSSDLGSLQSPQQPRSQADLAAQLARRLGAASHTFQEPTRAEDEADAGQSPVGRTTREVYKPHQPAPGRVFPDEPPPLEPDRSDDSDLDIFAEINKKQPYRHTSRADNSAADDLFGRQDIQQEPPALAPSAKQKQLLFEADSESELFASETPVETRTHQDTSTKKPVGGMSLFGSNANAESIGAAILKRNQRQAPSSGEEMNSEPIQTRNNVIKKQSIDRTNVDIEVKAQKEKERDIFEDLFAKSERINKNNKSHVKEEREAEKKPEKKKDLFSDNIFDDIDDIFTTDIKVVPKSDKNEQKSIFDDDDDLFSENENNITKSDAAEFVSKEQNKRTAQIFSDTLPDIKSEPKINVKYDNSKATKGLFDDSDDDLFSDVDKVIKTVHSKKDLFSYDDDLVSNKNTQITLDKENVMEEIPKSSTNYNKTIKESPYKPSAMILKSPDLFDDDDNGSFLFQSAKNKPKPEDAVENTLQQNYNILPNISESSKEVTFSSINLDINKKENISPELYKDKDSIFSDDDCTESFKEDDHVNKINVFESNKNETKLFDKLDTTIVQTKETTGKPNIFEKSAIADVLVHTKIEVKPNSETGSVISQNVLTSEGIVIDTTVTVVPEITSSNVNINDTKVIVKPDIAEKPIIVEKPMKKEEITLEKEVDNTTLDNVNKVDTNKNITESVFKDLSYTNDKPSVHANNTDIFSDIFNDQPPVFEKPKEPKRSKNVNALFDDDSDDESLFFKKNDVITEERPEGFVSSDDKLFGLFIDEPPAIDVDFVQKSNKVDRLSKANQNDIEIYKADLSDQTDNIFGNKDVFDKSESNNVNDHVEIDFNKKEDVFSDTTDNKCDKPRQNVLKNKEPEKKVVEKSEIENPEMSDNTSSETKKVGKLKPMNLNINVNTLLPGASPKKVVKIDDNTDGQAPSRSNNELYASDTKIEDELDTKITKSTSFDGNENSSVLDNKLSKERVKIQVKRRPSTRRARREAVKKSGIDFGEDSTDNSSSIDDQARDKTNLIKHDKDSVAKDPFEKHEYVDADENKVMSKIGQDLIDTANENVNISTEDIQELHGADIKNTNAEEKNIFSSNERLSDFDDSTSNIKPETIVDKSLSKSAVEAESTDKTEIKSKVVYILNDEDIFNSDTEKIHKDAKPTDMDTKTQGSSKPIFAETEDTKEVITTLEQVYKETKHKLPNLDLLSDSDDDNLFKTCKTTKQVPSVEQKQKAKENKHVEVKNVPLKSKNRQSFVDSDDELFKNKSIGNDNRKPSLFGSDSDEDLFGGVKKDKKGVKKIQTTKKENVARKKMPTTSLFEDDDDDLFGVKTKRSEPTPDTVKRSTEKELTKHSEPVYGDPLSLFGSDEN